MDNLWICGKHIQIVLRKRKKYFFFLLLFLFATSVQKSKKSSHFMRRARAVDGKPSPKKPCALVIAVLQRLQRCALCRCGFLLRWYGSHPELLFALLSAHAKKGKDQYSSHIGGTGRNPLRVALSKPTCSKIYHRGATVYASRTCA